MRTRAWAPDPREAEARGKANEWRESTSCTDMICGAEKGTLATNAGCGKTIPAGEPHALKGYAWRGPVKSRVWAQHFHDGCVEADINRSNLERAVLDGEVIVVCKVCGRVLRRTEGSPHIVWHGRCDGEHLEVE